MLLDGVFGYGPTVFHIERAFRRDKRVGVVANHRVECPCEFIRRSKFHREQAEPKHPGWFLQDFESPHLRWNGRVPEHTHARYLGRDLFEELQHLCPHLRTSEMRQSGHVSPGTCEAGNEP